MLGPLQISRDSPFINFVAGRAGGLKTDALLKCPTIHGKGTSLPKVGRRVAMRVCCLDSTTPSLTASFLMAAQRACSAQPVRSKFGIRSRGMCAT
jgi:hypothetical protein